jgi:ribosome biogenesis GTPase
MKNRPGLVVAAHGRRGILEADGQRQQFIPKGRGLRVVCGDRVRFEARAGSEALLVTAIEPRSNALARLHARTRREEVIAANITQLIAVCAPQPEPDPFLLDRYACAAEVLGCRFALVWNKGDLESRVPASAAGLAGLGYPLLVTSTLTGAGLDELSIQLAGQTTVLAGQSGVGKSSLINALFAGTDAAVGELSAATATGTHTTTAVVMYARDQGIRLLDTPGVRHFVPSVRSGQHLDRGFREMHEPAADCRFSNCRHLQEPGCAVRAEVAAGRISARRYASYCQLLATLEDGEPRPVRK